ncbi:effector-associated constant component EACC1 [Streptomyces sp. GC420]|uniref:effector-associated constant component EACC1 n=1 Tax=Streptomyces sp. GC420 TaxID=2697568 RepID=UPI001414E326|nr:hypothetical protein [Streptomyces sp. GC420]NBM15751.1 hypothetical protein [Streptomyces sp. GC420]
MEPERARIVVEPQDPAAAPRALDSLQDWFLKQGEIGETLMERVPRDEQPGTLGLVYDLVVQFSVAGATVTLGYLVRSIRSHLASQPDRDLRARLTVGDRTVVIKASGMTDAELEEIRRLVDDRMRRAPGA